jgi:hypothetical protein
MQYYAMKIDELQFHVTWLDLTNILGKRSQIQKGHCVCIAVGISRANVYRMMAILRVRERVTRKREI